MSTIWLNGRLVPGDRPAIDASDHGLLVGDGVFETAKVVDGEAFALTRSYTKAAELATAAKAAADAAAAEAVTGKEQMKTEATTLVAGVRSAVEAANAALAKAPKGKGTAADLEAMKSDVAGVAAALPDMDTAIADGKYKDAKVKAEAAKATLDKIVADVQAAIDAKKGK